MALSSRIKDWVNVGLSSLNLQIDTLTAHRTESSRLFELERSGHFDKPQFPLLPSFSRCDPNEVFRLVTRYAEYMARLREAKKGGFSYENDYFTGPDAEVAYALVREFKPGCIVEVGSGNSTELFHEAILDGKIETRLIAIDPSPKRVVKDFATQVITQRLEDVPRDWIKDALDGNGFLFIDSSHQILPGNDVVCLFLNIMPALRKGTIIHIHDVFLPFEYPRDWIIQYGRNWTEQYLLQALLQGSDDFEVIWAGHYFQRNDPKFNNYFTSRADGTVCSLWLRKVT